MRKINKLYITIFLFFVTSFVGMAAGFFGYTDTYRILTLEFKGENLAIVNVINFTNLIQVLEPSDILIIKSNGTLALGQVFPRKDQNGNEIYTASALIRPHSSFGTDLIGPFKYNGDVLKVYFTQGGRFFELAHLTRAEFNSFMSRLAQLDLDEKKVDSMFTRLSIPDLGRYIPFEEANSIRKLYNGLLTENGINPPKILKKNLPPLTENARRKGFSGKIKVKVMLDTMGNIRNIRFSPEPPADMAQRIRESMLNGWVFLPATYNGEVVPSEMTLELNYGASNVKRKTKINR